MNKASLLLLLAASFSAAAGQVLFKFGAHGHVRPLDFLNLPIVAGLVFYVLGTGIWIYVLSYEKLTNVYAFTALTFVLVYLAGVFLIGEKIALSAFIGIVLVLAGLYLIVAQP